MRLASEKWKEKHPKEYRNGIEDWRMRNKELVNATGKDWKKRNPESVRATSSKYKLKNADRIAEISRAYQPTRNKNSRRWSLNNPARRAEIYRRYQRNHPEKIRAANHKRRGLRAKAAGHWSQAAVALILMLQRGRCAYCSESDRLQIDHVVPLCRGGSNWPWNLQWLCGPHNASKGDKTDLEYRWLKGFPPVRRHLSLCWWLMVFAL